MTVKEIIDLTKLSELYNLHSHTQFCDGRASMDRMAQAASDAGFKVWGFSPHSPIPLPSPCNMTLQDCPEYIAEASRLKEAYAPTMTILTAMEIDYLSSEWGPHIDLFHAEGHNAISLDYRLGSIHFIPTQSGEMIDCDGSATKFIEKLKRSYRNDIRYVVERYFDQLFAMLERGGFEILSHPDKIIANAMAADPKIENESWYEALIDDVVSHAKTAGVIIEINTKSLEDRGRFFPAERWWNKFISARLPILVNSDAHHPNLINANRPEALKILKKLSL